jgi:hypothetical protein
MIRKGEALNAHAELPRKSSENTIAKPSFVTVAMDLRDLYSSTSNSSILSSIKRKMKRSFEEKLLYHFYCYIYY